MKTLMTITALLFGILIFISFPQANAGEADDLFQVIEAMSRMDAANTKAAHDRGEMTWAEQQKVREACRLQANADYRLGTQQNYSARMACEARNGL